MNRFEVAENVAKYIKVLEERKAERKAWQEKRLKIIDVCDELSIFDWWNDYLSLSQLKQMETFLKTACELGYNGYVCFKVGARGCSHGMWAHKNESTNDYSPDGEVLFHSFRSGDNYWDCLLPSGKWMGNSENKYAVTIQEVREALKTF